LRRNQLPEVFHSFRLYIPALDNLLSYVLYYQQMTSVSMGDSGAESRIATTATASNVAAATAIVPMISRPVRAMALAA
jgi:hypothetical protein